MNTYAQRRACLRQSLDTNRVLVITSLENVRYLTGFSGSNAVCAIGRDVEFIGTDGRYVDQVAQQAPDLTAIIDRDTLSAVLSKLPGARLEVEGSITAMDLGMCQKHDATTIVHASRVAPLRMIKDEQELALITTACDITVRALSALASELVVGMSEIWIARRLEQLFGEFGAQDRAFETIVGAGSHSAIPHHRPDSTAIRPGDFLVVDCGARVDGYHADMTRTFLVAAEPKAWQSELHAAVWESQTLARAEVRDGASSATLDSVARSSLTAAGLGQEFTHGLGHGVGLQIHEPPFLGPRATGSIAAGMTITVEPGAYLPGRGGVRIEDTLAVTASGAQVLTEASRALDIVAV